MELTINLTREDIWQFHKYLNFRSRYRKINVVLSILIYPLLYFGLRWGITQSLGESTFHLLLTLAIWIPLYFWFWKRDVKNAPWKNSSQLGSQIVGIAPDRIYSKGVLFEGSTLWQGVLEITQNLDYIFIFTERYRAYLIPKRAFSNISEATVFHDTAVTFWKTIQT